MQSEKKQDTRILVVSQVITGSKIHGCMNMNGYVDVPELFDDRYTFIVSSLPELVYNFSLPLKEFRVLQEFKKKFPKLGYLPNKFDNPKVEMKKLDEGERSIFAKEKIKAGEIITAFQGPIYRAKKLSDVQNLPPIYARDQTVRIAKVLYGNGKDGLV